MNNIFTDIMNFFMQHPLILIIGVAILIIIGIVLSKVIESGESSYIPPQKNNNDNESWNEYIERSERERKERIRKENIDYIEQAQKDLDEYIYNRNHDYANFIIYPDRYIEKLETIERQTSDYEIRAAAKKVIKKFRDFFYGDD